MVFWFLFHPNAGRVRALRFQYSIVLQTSATVVVELVQRFHAFLADLGRVVILQGYLYRGTLQNDVDHLATRVSFGVEERAGKVVRGEA